MKSWLDALASAGWRRQALAGAALLSLALLPALPRLDTDNSPEVFFVEGSRAAERYHEFRRRFGSDRVVRLVARGDGLWTAAGLEWLGELERRAAALPGVLAASGLYRHHRRSAWPPADPAVFRHRVTSDPLDRSMGWVAGEGSVASVLVVLAGLSPPQDRQLMDRLLGLPASPPAGVTAELVGLPVLNHALDASSREIERRYFPLLILFTLALLWLCLRDAVALVIPLVFVAFCELLAVAPMGYLGVDLNLVLAVLPPLVFVIALATALHLLLYFRSLRSTGATGPGEACAATYREKGWSVLWTGLTTMIGFASLAVSPLGPVRSLGVWAGTALALMTLAAFLLYPALLTADRRPRSGRPPSWGLEPWARRRGRRWARWAHTRRRWVLGLATVLALVAAAGVPRLRLESNALRYFAADHPVRAGIEALEAAGIGAAAVEILITDRRPFASAAALAPLGELGEILEEEPLVYGTLSAESVLRDAASRFPPFPILAPAARRQQALAVLEADTEGRELLAALRSADLRTTRLTAFVKTTGIDELEPLIERLRQLGGERFPGAEIEVTGRYPLLLEAQRTLFSTLGLSLALTLACVALILRRLLPGLRLTLLALLPNLWPVVGVLGVMGWAGVPLDIATVMVASVVLGLAVDDTLHTLGHFRRLAPLHGAREAMVRTLETTAPAYLLTGVILAAGFGVCALSDFAPIARFGALSAFAVALAVVGDLFLLPALLSLTPAKTVGRMGESPRQQPVP